MGESGFYLQSEGGAGYSFDSGCYRKQEQEQYTASTNGSVDCGSSIKSGSQGSSPDPNYTTSPNTQYGSLTSVWSPGTQYDSSMMDAWTPNTQYDPPMSLWSPKLVVQSQEMKDLPPFNIEEEGDPGISWWMYYDFVATRTEAYYRLQPGYVPTEKYPERRACEKVIIDNKRYHPCLVPDCNMTKPFNCYDGLYHHFKIVHQGDREQDKDGKQDIHWTQNYEFIVTKTKAYYQLRQGVSPTESRPECRACEEVIIDGKRCHPCRVPNCSNKKPFTRHYDLDRHFETFHRAERKQSKFINCDYKNCPHTEPFRKDHCREHYREYHNEDLLKRSRFKESKTNHVQEKVRHGQGKSESKPQTVEEFLESRRIDDRYLKWWRCSKCILRVKVRSDGYTCPRCNVPCEAGRKAWREKQAARIAENERSIAFDNGSQAGDSASDWASCIDYPV